MLSLDVEGDPTLALELCRQTGAEWSVEKKEIAELKLDFSKAPKDRRFAKNAEPVWNVAAGKLAKIHLRRLEWKLALRCLETWTPNHWCGSCRIEQEKARLRAIVLCRIRLAVAWTR